MAVDGSYVKLPHIVEAGYITTYEQIDILWAILREAQSTGKLTCRAKSTENSVSPAIRRFFIPVTRSKGNRILDLQDLMHFFGTHHTFGEVNTKTFNDRYSAWFSSLSSSITL